MNFPPSDNDAFSRRDALKTIAAGAAVLGLGIWGESPVRGADAGGAAAQLLALPKLPYAYDALEPHIDARTMEIHYTKHHQAYVNNANKILEAQPELRGLDGEALLKKLSIAPEAVRTTLKNNVGGHVNHSFFWQILAPNAGGQPQGELGSAIDSTFGSFDALKTQFTDVALKRFGSGWAWLAVTHGKLTVTSTANQDPPLLENAFPVLGLDVWEHAYYLKYQNRRNEYVAAFWNLANWERANTFYRAALHA